MHKANPGQFHIEFLMQELLSCIRDLRAVNKSISVEAAQELNTRIQDLNTIVANVRMRN